MSSDSIRLGQLVGLVETMRQAQIKFFEISNDRTGKYHPHQRTRALQAARVAEQRVDAWLVEYHEAERKLAAWVGERKTDEQLGLYDVGGV
jgi:hypothetical protein